jgi:hypothetical protein
VKSSSDAAVLQNKNPPAILKKLTSSNFSNLQNDKRLFHLVLNNEGPSDANYQPSGMPS